MGQQRPPQSPATSKPQKSTDDAPDLRTQAEKFEDAARELGCDEDEDRFKGVLRKMPKKAC